jgi:hypothetical protein
VQRIMDDHRFHGLFPSVTIPGQFGVRGSATRRLTTSGWWGTAAVIVRWAWMAR